MSEILVIGHRNPDTDSICSAIGYAEFKRLQGEAKVVAARCGDINDRIDFVLREFGMAPPRFVADVSPKVRDVMQHQVSSIAPDASASEALSMMEAGNIRVLPIMDEDRYCHGLISVFKMARFLMPSGRSFRSRQVVASIGALCRNLEADLKYATHADREEDLILMVGAMSRESLERRLPGYPAQRLVVITGDRRDVQELAIGHGVRAVIVTGGLEVDEAVVEAARGSGVCLLVSPLDSASTVMLCRSSIGVEHMKHEHYLSFQEHERIADIRETAVASRFLAFPVLDAHKRVVGVLSKTDLLKRVDRKLILVDHNELSQAVAGADQVEIVEIIDHHRIGPFTSAEPMLFVNRPVGSTCTIVADLFFTYGLPLARPVAGLLMAGLISDTLNLTSPTTTQLDAAILGRLSSITSLDPEKFTQRLFSSGSVLTSRPVEEAIAADCKEYEHSERRFSIAQIEEIGFKSFWDREEGIGRALEAYRNGKGLYFSGLLVTDVVRQSSLLLLAGEPEFLSRIHYPRTRPGVYQLKGVVSRKKQLLPYLIHTLEHLVNRSVSQLAGLSPDEITARNQECLITGREHLKVLLSSTEDSDIHYALQDSEALVASLERSLGKHRAILSCLLLCEQDSHISVLFAAGEDQLLQELDLPLIKDRVYEVSKGRASRDFVVEILNQLMDSPAAGAILPGRP